MAQIETKSLHCDGDLFAALCWQNQQQEMSG